MLGLISDNRGCGAFRVRAVQCVWTTLGAMLSPWGRGLAARWAWRRWAWEVVAASAVVYVEALCHCLHGG